MTWSYSPYKLTQLLSREKMGTRPIMVMGVSSVFVGNLFAYVVCYIG